MKYTLCFHAGCTDGIASAAVLAFVLRERGDTIAEYRPVTFPRNAREWVLTPFPHPPAVVDFLYHPDAPIWFDHHPTSFLDPAWEKSFHPDAFHRLELRPSCTSLIVDHSKHVLGMKLPKRFDLLARWLDIFDSAAYATPAAALRCRYPAEQISCSLRENGSQDQSTAYQALLVRALRDKPLGEVARIPAVRKRFLAYKTQFEASREELKRRIVVQGNVAFIDVSDHRVVGSRFIAFALHPGLNYVVRLLRRATFELSVGRNPWNPPKSELHIGELLRIWYGGGGHAYVGGARFPNKADALCAAEEIRRCLEAYP